REFGVLALSPLYIPLFAAVVLGRSHMWTLLVPCMLLFIPTAAFDEWWGGSGPAARYLLPIIPFCAVAFVQASRFRAFRLVAGSCSFVRLSWTPCAGSIPMDVAARHRVQSGHGPARHSRARLRERVAVRAAWVDDLLKRRRYTPADRD